MGNQFNPFNQLSPTYKLPEDYNKPQPFSVVQQPKTNLDFSHINPRSLNPYRDTAQPEKTDQQPPAEINQQPQTNLNFSHINPRSLKKYYGKKVEIDPALKKQLIKRGMYDKLNELEYPFAKQREKNREEAGHISNNRVTSAREPGR